MTDTSGLTPDSPASSVLHARLAGLASELAEREAEVRAGVEDGVHQLRVVCRRLRGLLATYRPLLDREVTDPVRDELRWVAQELGDGRDAEVVRDRLRELVAAVPAPLVVGPVLARIDSEYAERLDAAGAHAAEVLDSARYRALVTAVKHLVAAPPFTTVAEEPAAGVLRRRVRKDFGRLADRVALLRALDEVGEQPGDEAEDEALHDVRKAAKRLRYACEVLEPVWGADAKALRKAAQEVTQVLGERQDTTVTRADLLRLADRATAAGESAFTFGVLHAREEARADELGVELTAVWRRARRKRLRRWL